jgi:hypothetical protein
MPMMLPDVTGMSNAEAAETYARHGFHVTPVRPGTKAPYVDRWPERATCDLDTVREHWRGHPDDGIAIHVGGCGLLVIDVDRPEIVAHWLWPLLEQAVFRPTTTDENSRRGHYFYRLRPDEMFGCGRGGLKLSDGEAAGFEVKCYGGAIVVGPTHHPRADEGGRYATEPVALIPFRPDEIAAKLNPASSNGERRPLTPAELDEKAQTFLSTYTDDDEPQALPPILRRFDPTQGERHSTMFDALCWAMREAKAGRFPAQRAADELQKNWVAAAHGREDEFERMVRDAIARADAESVDELRARAAGFSSVETYHNARKAIENGQPLLRGVIAEPDTPDTRSSRFRLVSAWELAEPVTPMRWLVRGIWPERSAGVLAGDKKSMKTWNLQAIALAVASGTALFDEYHVVTSGPVLYLSGEGGQNTFANRHQVIAARYYITPELLRALPFGVEFGVGTLTDKDFIDAVKRHLDTLQPKLVILDPLYAYHPNDVEVTNVYARGRMLTGLQSLVGGEAALIVGDHFNKTAGKNLDLDNIAQAGMAAWADSWILQKHRDTPNLDENKYWLEVETGTRRGGGKHLEVDWSMERNRNDPDVILWSGVDWESRPMTAKSAVGQVDKTVQAILQIVCDHPFEFTETQVLDKIGGRREKARDALLGLKANGGVVAKRSPRTESGRTMTRHLVGPGQDAERLRLNRFRLGEPAPGPDDAERVDGSSSYEGTGSERVTDE